MKFRRAQPIPEVSGQMERQYGLLIDQEALLLTTFPVERTMPASHSTRLFQARLIGCGVGFNAVELSLVQL